MSQTLPAISTSRVPFISVSLDALNFIFFCSDSIVTPDAFITITANCSTKSPNKLRILTLYGLPSPLTPRFSICNWHKGRPMFDALRPNSLFLWSVNCLRNESAQALPNSSIKSSDTSTASLLAASKNTLTFSRMSCVMKIKFLLDHLQDLHQLL